MLRALLIFLFAEFSRRIRYLVEAIGRVVHVVEEALLGQLTLIILLLIWLPLLRWHAPNLLINHTVLLVKRLIRLRQPILILLGDGVLVVKGRQDLSDNLLLGFDFLGRHQEPIQITPVVVTLAPQYLLGLIDYAFCILIVLRKPKRRA